MRLQAAEIQIIVEVIAGFVADSTAALYLYGSRTDDSKKGGDIDLLLVVDEATKVSVLCYHKVDILAQIKAVLGEQKIDLLIAARENLRIDPFLSSIYPSAILLKQWSLS